MNINAMVRVTIARLLSQCVKWSVDDGQVVIDDTSQTERGTKAAFPRHRPATFLAHFSESSICHTAIYTRSPSCFCTARENGRPVGYRHIVESSNSPQTVGPLTYGRLCKRILRSDNHRVAIGIVLSSCSERTMFAICKCTHTEV